MRHPGAPSGAAHCERSGTVRGARPLPLAEPELSREELADRIGIIDHGRLIACGTLETLRVQASVDGSLEEVFLKMTEETAAGESPARV